MSVEASTLIHPGHGLEPSGTYEKREGVSRSAAIVVSSTFRHVTSPPARGPEMTRRAHRDSTVCAVIDMRPVSGSRGAAHTMPCHAMLEDHSRIYRSYACRMAMIPVLRGTILSHRSEEHTSELQSQSNIVCR